MLAVVKLRQKGTKMRSKLPRSVFRYMQEYKFTNELSIKYYDPYAPIWKQQNRNFPAVDKLNYNNCLVAFIEY